MLSIINIDNGNNKLIHGCHNCSTTHNLILMMFVGYVKVRESLYALVIIWVDTSLNHVDTRVVPGHFLPRYECPCMVYRHE